MFQQSSTTRSVELPQPTRRAVGKTNLDKVRLNTWKVLAVPDSPCMSMYVYTYRLTQSPQLIGAWVPHGSAKEPLSVAALAEGFYTRLGGFQFH